MPAVAPPGHLSARALADWTALQSETRAPRAFDPADADALPAPVRRWVRHAIAPGTPLRRGVVLSSHGTIMIGRWRPFTARQVLAPFDGYVWAATTHLPLPRAVVHGFDRYRAGVGEMRWRLFGVVPVMSGEGPDITLSAAGRLAGEFVLAPPCALDPSIVWKHVDKYRAVARVTVDDRGFDVTLDIDPAGRLAAVAYQRRHGSADETFTATFAGETTFDGGRCGRPGDRPGHRPSRS
ncbi:hypothetical protein OIE66_18180 [Nonomuraea sp. NBC_01738]|uniref:DUF6544 family protein n=1 Tax=Nonomuraea sp. NBC_01738 TaxID=2976003 RepID=UPI002E154C4A|nr:hypothetical protein OIE66_18180 [Nonomuraea sp. NBC_01738]